MAVSHAQGNVGEINTLLGKGSAFDGKLTFEGTVRIDGKLSGEVFSDDILIVGEGAEVNAEVEVGEIIIQGSVVGNIKAKRGVEIHAPGRVKGDITTPSLQIDKGVAFEGRSFMDNASGDPGKLKSSKSSGKTDSLSGTASGSTASGSTVSGSSTTPDKKSSSPF